MCDGSGESRQKARRKLERGLMPNKWQMRSAHFEPAQFFLDGAGCSDPPSIVNLIGHQENYLIADFGNDTECSSAAPLLRDRPVRWWRAQVL